MKPSSPLYEGSPCRAIAAATAAVGVLVFGGITLAVFLLPEELRAGHYIVGSITGILTLVMFPWQMLDLKARKHILTDQSIIYRCGVLSCFEVEVPYRGIQAVTVRQGIFQRLFGCGDVRVSAQGVSGPLIISQQDMNSVCLRSIKDFAAVAERLRQKMNEQAPAPSGERDTPAPSRS